LIPRGRAEPELVQQQAQQQQVLPAHRPLARIIFNQQTFTGRK
jgi:hypothetical protein